MKSETKSAKPLTCQKCGLVQEESELRTERIFLSNNRDYHLKASCSSCGAYIKFLPHDPIPQLHFGKYKGWPIAEINRIDPDYIKWLLKQDIKPKLRATILEVLR